MTVLPNGGTLYSLFWQLGSSRKKLFKEWVTLKMSLCCPDRSIRASLTKPYSHFARLIGVERTLRSILNCLVS